MVDDADRQDIEPGAESAEPEAVAEMVSAEQYEAVVAERDRYLRALADADTRARRAAEQAQIQVARANEGFLLGILPVLSGVTRALDAARSADDLEQMGTGLELIDRQLHSFLESVGAVFLVPSPGDPFDPERHEAVYSQPPSAAVPVGHIVGVIEPGIMLHGQLLQPARVAVAAAE